MTNEEKDFQADNDKPPLLITAKGEQAIPKLCTAFNVTAIDGGNIVVSMFYTGDNTPRLIERIVIDIGTALKLSSIIQQASEELMNVFSGGDGNEKS